VDEFIERATEALGRARYSSTSLQQTYGHTSAWELAPADAERE
jgi:hypothetical protein